MDDSLILDSFSYKKYPNKENTLVFLESGDEVLNYIETCSYFMGSTIDITFGGSHSYESLNKNLKTVSVRAHSRSPPMEKQNKETNKSVLLKQMEVLVYKTDS